MEKDNVAVFPRSEHFESPVPARMTVADRTTGKPIADDYRLVDMLTRSVSAPGPSTASQITVPIQTFAPEPYEPREPLQVVVEPYGDSFVATWFDAEVSASGDNEVQAVHNLKEWIIDLYERLSEFESDALGSVPRRQLAVMQHLLVKID